MTYDPAVPRIENTLYVDSVNGDDTTAERGTMGLKYQTIQAAINASLDGDTILVATGTYTETLTIPASFSRLTIQALGFGNATLVGDINWNPNTAGPQILFVVDIFNVGDVNYDATAKTGGSSIARFKQCRMFGNWNATGLGLTDFFQISNCSFATATFTQNDCVAQITAFVPQNSTITTWTQNASVASDARISGPIITTYTAGANSVFVGYTTQINSFTFGGTTARLLGCDIYGTLTCNSGSYIDVRESQIAGVTLVGPGEIDRTSVIIPVTTPGDSSTGNIVTIDPPFANADYGVIQTTQDSTVITPTGVHDLLYNQFQYDDTGAVQNINFMLTRGVS